MTSKFFFGATLHPLSHFVSPVFTMMHFNANSKFQRRRQGNISFSISMYTFFSKMMRNNIEYNAVTINSA